MNGLDVDHYWLRDPTGSPRRFAWLKRVETSRPTERQTTIWRRTARSAALTLARIRPRSLRGGFPLAVASPFFCRTSALERSRPHLDRTAGTPRPSARRGARCSVLAARVEANGCGTRQRPRSRTWQLMRPLVQDAARLIPDLLAPPGGQRHLIALVQFGQHALRSASGFA